MPITNTVKNKVLNLLVGKDNDYATVYVGLSSTAPDSSGGNITEPKTGGYGRVPVGNYQSSANQLFGSPSNGEISNSKYIYFPESSGDWGDPLTHFFLSTSETGGTVLGYGELTADGVPTPVIVNAAKTVVMFRPHSLTITIRDDV